MELKFVNKLAIIRELIELNAAAAAQQTARDGGFYDALDRSAAMLGEEKQNGV